MKALVVYDSQYGNTEAVAQAIGGALGADVVCARAMKPGALLSFDLVIVGSPTQGGRPTPAVKQFLEDIPEGGLKDVDVATFDTRIPAVHAGWIGRIALSIFGYAAPRIARALHARGGRVVASEGFAVLGKEGPLAAGELERAAGWARAIQLHQPAR
jgi:hypothetical protein